jgi:hypothetical protein
LIFSELQNEALKFNKKCEVLICGDFNARTRGLQDFILNDDVKEISTKPITSKLSIYDTKSGSFNFPLFRP